MSETALALYFNNRPPEKTGQWQVLSTASGAAAASYDWIAALAADAPKGNVHLVLEALTQDVYVRFGPTATTATTASNGRIVKAGAPGVSFYVSPVTHRFIDHIAAGAGGTLKVQVASPIGERTNQ